MKQQFISAWQAERQALLSAVDGVDETTLTTVPVCGTWTARDVLAHVVAVDVASLHALRQARTGENVTWPWDSYPDGDSWNAAEVASRADRSVAQIRAELEASQRDVLAELELLPESWDAEKSPCGWLPDHDREHSAAIGTLRSR